MGIHERFSEEFSQVKGFWQLIKKNPNCRDESKNWQPHSSFPTCCELFLDREINIKHRNEPHGNIIKNVNYAAEKLKMEMIAPAL